MTLSVVVIEKYERKLLRNVYGRRYEITQFKTLAALVLYWHENFGHVDADTMVDIVINGAYTNLPEEVTPSVTRKYFPSTERRVLRARLEISHFDHPPTWHQRYQT